MTPNLGYLFHNWYFNLITEKDWKKIANGEEPGKNLLNTLKRFHDIFTESRVIPDFSDFDIEYPHEFTLMTTYPGLLTGSGLSHGVGIENEFALGFHFDHTTGLPVIPASGIKGVLRSAFPSETERYAPEKEAYIKELLGKQSEPDFDATALKKEIFCGLYKGEALPRHQRDIFFDARLTPSKNSPKKILGDDYITPHKNELKDPNPIRFLKVMPEVKFIFGFDLKESHDQSVTATDKLNLFKTILLDMGVGAKTNVGYGQFSPSD